MKEKLNLKYLILLSMLWFLAITNLSFVFATSEELSLVSEAALLVDNKTGKILYEKNKEQKMYPASTTKIMTAILTLENCNLNDVVTVSYDAAMSIPDGYSSASLQIGEKLTVEQLLEVLLVHSANDAANVLAEYVGGSIESFVSMMNTKVNELGLSHTHFTNTFGMHNDNHYTTAYDLATIMKYCIQNENFRKLSGKASCAIPATNQYGTRRYTSTNALIVPNNKNYYPHLTCGKTGYTSQAGDCLVSCAYQEDLELICVILGGKTINGTSTRFSETKNLYQYAYENYAVKTLLHTNDVVTELEIKSGTKDTKNLSLLAENDINALVKNSLSVDSLTFDLNLQEDIKAPINQGDILGSVNYSIDGIEYKTNLIASHSVEKSKLLEYSVKLGIVFLILILIHWIFFHKKKQRKKRKCKVYKI